MRDAVVFPREVVEALADKPAVGFELILRVNLLRADRYPEGLRLAGREVGLEDDDVGLWYASKSVSTA
jgi:hypothetical protein